MDSKRTVCSLPPIINSDHSKISLETTNVFIECTATDVTKANIVLNQLVAMFSQYCGEATGDASQKFTVEPVKVIYPEKRKLVEKEMMYPLQSMYIASHCVSLPVSLSVSLSLCLSLAVCVHF